MIAGQGVDISGSIRDRVVQSPRWSCTHHRLTNPNEPMPYRLIAIDLDGTLLDPGHRLSPGSAAAIAACVARGGRVVLATGRSFTSAAPSIHELVLH